MGYERPFLVPGEQYPGQFKQKKKKGGFEQYVKYIGDEPDYVGRPEGAGWEFDEEATQYFDPKSDYNKPVSQDSGLKNAALAGGTAYALAPAATTAATTGATTGASLSSIKAGTAGTTAATGGGLSAAATSGLIAGGAMLAMHIQQQNAAREQRRVDDIMRQRREKVAAIEKGQVHQDRALEAIERIYENYTARA